MNPKNQDSSQKSNNRKNKKPVNDFVKYSAIAFQMIVIILIGVFGGMKLDQVVNMEFPLFTLIFSLLSVALAIYYSIKDFLKR